MSSSDRLAPAFGSSIAAWYTRRRSPSSAAMLDPNAGANLSLDDIHAMCDELIAAHGDRMPEGIRA